jgi:protein-disulfide isomerase
METNATKSVFMEKYLTPIAVLVGAVLITLALIFGHGGSGAENAGAPKAAQAPDIKKVNTDGEPYVGSANAPVTLAVWFDYQCPFCKQFDQTVVTQLEDTYVKEGKLKIVFKDFQFLGEDSQTAALYGRAVWEAYPDHYYDWLQGMFAAQDDEGDQGFGDLASITAMTKEKVPAIDTGKIEKLMTDKKSKFEAAIAASRSEGASFGINGTPSVILGTQLLSGGPLYDLGTMKGLIDAELKK